MRWEGRKCQPSFLCRYNMPGKEGGWVACAATDFCDIRIRDRYLTKLICPYHVIEIRYEYLTFTMYDGGKDGRFAFDQRPRLQPASPKQNSTSICALKVLNESKYQMPREGRKRVRAVQRMISVCGWVARLNPELHSWCAL